MHDRIDLPFSPNPDLQAPMAESLHKACPTTTGLPYPYNEYTQTWDRGMATLNPDHATDWDEYDSKARSLAAKYALP